MALLRSARGAFLLTACVAISAPTWADAATATAPSPTVSVTTSLAGKALPTSTVTASWQITHAGQDATLSIQGTPVAPTSTWVTATWYSSVRSVAKNRSEFDVSVDNQHSYLVPGSPNNELAYVVYQRVIPRKGRPGPWQRVDALSTTDQYAPLMGSDGKVDDTLTSSVSQLKQWRVDITMRCYDTSSEKVAIHIWAR